MAKASYRPSSSFNYSEKISPKKSNINPDEEITDEEDEIDISSINDQLKEHLFNFFSNLNENVDLINTHIPIQLLNKKSLLESFADLMCHVDQLIK